MTLKIQDKNARLIESKRKVHKKTKPNFRKIVFRKVLFEKQKSVQQPYCLIKLCIRKREFSTRGRNKYSQTCVQRPPLGSENCGRYAES
jgi:hypothetical protein